MKQRNASHIPLRDKCLQIKSGNFDFISSVTKVNYDSNFTLSVAVNEQILYYIAEYGSKEELIKFYVKHSLWKQTFDTFLNDSSCLNNVNLFVKEIFIPAVKSAQISELLKALKSADPILSRIWKCLLVTCKYLNNNSLFNALHILQVFMGDYLRAAITQINCFYINPPAVDYVELYSRVEHLHRAVQYCSDYLLFESNRRSGCLLMDKSDVTKQIRTLNLQIDITNKFNESKIKGFLPIDVMSDANVTKDIRSPPTLLDHSKARRTELAALVIINFGSTIAEGFTVARQIIKVIIICVFLCLFCYYLLIEMFYFRITIWTLLKCIACPDEH